MERGLRLAAALFTGRGVSNEELREEGQELVHPNATQVSVECGQPAGREEGISSLAGAATTRNEALGLPHLCEGVQPQRDETVDLLCDKAKRQR